MENTTLDSEYGQKVPDMQEMVQILQRQNVMVMIPKLIKMITLPTVSCHHQKLLLHLFYHLHIKWK